MTIAFPVNTIPLVDSREFADAFDEIFFAFFVGTLLSFLEEAMGTFSRFPGREFATQFRLPVRF